MQVAARELKNRLGKYLKRVRAGESVVVTDRGVPVAELRPIDVGSLSPEDRLQRMADAGEFTQATGKRVARFEPVSVRGKHLSLTLLEDRE
jgi:prevent-host-death family protein